MASMDIAVQAERERGRRREHLVEGENEVLKMIIDRAPLPAVLEALTRVAERQSTSGLLASVLLMGDDGIHLRHGAAPSLPPAYSMAIDGVAIGPGVGSCGTAAWRRSQVIVSDIDTDPLWAGFRELAARHGLRACWSTPIMSSKGTVLGTFALYYRHACEPTDEDESTINILTRTAALAIEHYRTENELAESEERFRSLSRCAPVGVFMIDSTGAFKYVNPRFVEMAGFGHEKTFDYWLENATGRSDTLALWRNAMGAGAEYAAEFAIRLNGRERTVSLQMAPMRSRANDYLGYAGTLEDISARIAGEASLRRESNLRRAVERAVPCGIAVVGPDGTQTHVNPAFAAMTGWTEDELVGAKAPFPYWPPEEAAAIEKAVAAALSGTAPSGGLEMRFRRSNGALFEALVHIAPLNDDRRPASGYVASVSDITEQKRRSQQAPA